MAANSLWIGQRGAMQRHLNGCGHFVVYINSCYDVWLTLAEEGNHDY